MATTATGQSTGTTTELYVRLLGFKESVGELFATDSLEPAEALETRLAEAYLTLFSRDRPGADAASKIAQGLRARAHLASRLDDRAEGHLAAIEAWGRGAFERSRAILADLVRRDPTDVLAVFGAHFLAFFLGEPEETRDALAAASTTWPRRSPCFGFALGMLAFGLEETGRWEAAEAVGRQALDLRPDDVWALHAVVHSFEMRGRLASALELLDALEPHWGSGNFLAVHNAWHQALLLADAGETAAALAVYDGRLHPPERPPNQLDLVDQASLLWRLLLAEDAQSERWAALAREWEGLEQDQPWGESWYAFHDLHRIMVLVGAGRLAEAKARVAELGQFALVPGQGDDVESTNRVRLGEVGVAVADALVAFGDGDHARVVEQLWSRRRLVHRLGGSWAQQDVFQRTLLEAAIRAGAKDEARQLVAERLVLRADNPYAWWAAARLARHAGDEEAAADHERQARARQALAASPLGRPERS